MSKNLYSDLIVNGNIYGTSSASTKINLMSGAGVWTYLASDGTGSSFGSLSNHPVVFYQQNSEKVRIHTNGYLGIGTQLPVAPLDVNGVSKFNHNGSIAYTLFQNNNEINTYDSSDSPSSLFIQAAQGGITRIGKDNLVIYSNYTGSIVSGLTITTASNVGIGTAQPGANLEVYGISDSVGMINSGGNSYLKLRRGISNADAYVSFDTITNQKHIIGLTNNSDNLIVGGTEANPSMIISTSSFIGIGTASPSTNFHIYSTQSGVFRLQDTTQGSGKVLTSDSNGVATWQNVISGSGTNNYVVKWTSGGVSLGNSLIQDNGTNMSIGGSINTGYLLTIVSTGGKTSLNVENSSSSSSSKVSLNLNSYGSGSGVNTAISANSQNSSTSNITANFSVSGGSNDYFIKLQKGSNLTTGQFLKSMTSDGKADWSSISIGDLILNDIYSGEVSINMTASYHYYSENSIPGHPSMFYLPTSPNRGDVVRVTNLNLGCDVYSTNKIIYANYGGTPTTTPSNNPFSVPVYGTVEFTYLGYASLSSYEWIVTGYSTVV